MDRTGIEKSTKASKQVLLRDPKAFRQISQAYIQEAEPVGGLRLPPSSAELSKRERALLDKIGERMAFERSATRLWEAFRTKFQVLGDSRGDIESGEIESIRNEELSHFLMLQEVVQEMGADPTLLTPSADLAGIHVIGLFQILNDPRTDLDQCLQAMLAAELINNDAWQTLCDLAEVAGRDEWLDTFRRAAAEEEEHLACVRTWIFDRTVNVEPDEDYVIEVTTVFHEGGDEDDEDMPKPAAKRSRRARGKAGAKKSSRK